MSSEVKHYWPEELVGTGELVVYLTDYAALEAELAKLKGEYEWVASINTALDESNQSAWGELARLRAGQEPVAYITGQFAGRCVIEAINRAAVLPTGMALYAAPQPSAVTAGWKLVPEMVSAAEEAHMPFGDMDIALRMAILAAPSAPKADDPVKQMLLGALEALSKSAPSACCVDFHHRPCDYHGADKPCPALDRYEAARLAARAAIAAARKEGGKV